MSFYYLWGFFINPLRPFTIFKGVDLISMLSSYFLSYLLEGKTAAPMIPPFCSVQVFPFPFLIRNILIKLLKYVHQRIQKIQSYFDAVIFLFHTFFFGLYFKLRMNKCPVQNCGRTFDSLHVLQQHLKRRHPRYLAETTQSHHKDKGAQEQVMQEEINKLPKIRQLKMQQREQKPVQVYRKSISKGKPEHRGPLNTSKVTSVISDSRNFLETAENNERKSRRPSLNKKGSSSELTNIKQERLPELKAVRQKKLEIIGSQGSKLNKTTSQDQKDPMSMTAPNFGKFGSKDKVKGKSKSKDKLNISELQDELQGKKSQTQKMVLIKTQQGFQGFQEKESKIHHHRPLLKKTHEKQKTQAEKTLTENEPKESEQMKNESPKQIKRTLEIKKELKLKSSKRDSSLRKAAVKSQQNIDSDINFQERIVVFKQTSSSRLVIPPSARCEYLYANNQSLSSITLNNVQTLRQISLQHNSLKDLSFLNYTNNHNIEKLFVDHNQLTFLDYLPPNLKVISATFNLIEGLQNTSRELGSLSNLQQLDLTFNPIRKQPNYKLHIISSCLSLKKIDGIKITNFDLQLASQYSRMLDEELGLIPSNKFQNLVVSKCSNSPSTVISVQQQPEDQDNDMTYQQLQREISKLKKISKQTQNNLKIIKQENEIIAQEIEDLKGKEEESQFDSAALYQKLKAECQALELLNFMQYASEEELEELIMKKEREILAA